MGTFKDALNKKLNEKEGEIVVDTEITSKFSKIAIIPMLAFMLYQEPESKTNYEKFSQKKFEKYMTQAAEWYFSSNQFSKEWKIKNDYIERVKEDIKNGTIKIY